MNRRTTPARGSCKRDDPKRENPQIVARFDRETFDEIAAIAARNGWSFNETLRLLVEWGLEDMRAPIRRAVPPRRAG
jgi:hypothetical protein